MKTRMMFAGVLLAVSYSFIGRSLALTPVKESFNTALDPARWLVSNSTNGKLKQGKARLNFTIGPNRTEEDYASAELNNNQPGYNESWQVIVDVTNKSDSDGDVGAGIYISNAANPINVLYFEFYGDGKGRHGGFQASILKDQFGNYLEPHLIANPRVKSGSLRITFNKNTKLITFHYDETGKEDGYKWKRVGTFSPTGVGGDKRLNWNMDDLTGKFRIGLEAFGEEFLLKGGKVFMDNFALKPL